MKWLAVQRLTTNHLTTNRLAIPCLPISHPSLSKLVAFTLSILVAGCGQQQRGYVHSTIDDAMYLHESAEDDHAPDLRDSDSDRHDVIDTHPFISAAHQPLSTFSIDVDTASYSKVRQHLRDYRRLPRPDAVRIEELVNYFDYQYALPDPESSEPIATRFAVTNCPWNDDHQLVRIALKGRDIDWQQRDPANLVLLIDTSGSMEASNKLPLLQRSLLLLLSQLSPQDRIAIVAYAGSAGLVLNSTAANARDEISRAIRSLRPYGSTNGGDGLRLAYQIARDHFQSNGVNRVLLCTDGDFNVGQRSNDELVRMIERESASGIDLTVLGFGMGNLNDSMLEQISNRGNGNYAFIDSASEARKVLVQQVTSTLVTIAKDVKIQVELNPKAVAGYRLLGYENRLLSNEDFNDDSVDAGEIGAGHTVTAFYEIIPAGLTTDILRDIDPLKYSAAKTPVADPNAGELMTVKLRYKLPGESNSRWSEHVVVNDSTRFDLADADFRFAAAVAGFGMSLRQVDQGKPWKLADIQQVAQSALGNDSTGLRSEFVNLVQTAAQLSER
ncbi:von Willebrand factor type A domain-containing protein [Rubripirellula amarantea]|nr:von Willebrand factor type A domain-containing protein [Rubripirellula amarantea]